MYGVAFADNIAGNRFTISIKVDSISFGYCSIGEINVGDNIVACFWAVATIHKPDTARIIIVNRVS